MNKWERERERERKKNENNKLLSSQTLIDSFNQIKMICVQRNFKYIIATWMVNAFYFNLIFFLFYIYNIIKLFIIIIVLLKMMIGRLSENF
jgi:hypothetical protein